MLSLLEAELLIALDDETGKARSPDELRYVLAGAALMELGMSGCLAVDGGKLAASASCTEPGDPLLREALETVRGDDKRRSAKQWVRRLPTKVDLRDGVAQALVSQGVLEEQRSRLLGLVERTRYPQRDPGPERELRERLQQVLVDGAEPTEREALLIALLDAQGHVKAVVPKDRRKDAERAARAIADQGVVGSAVKDVLQEITAATVAAVAAGAVVAAGSS